MCHVSAGAAYSRFLAMQDSNQPAELQRLARMLKFACSKFINYTFQSE